MKVEKIIIEWNMMIYLAICLMINFIIMSLINVKYREKFKKE
jgi:hypothetical protein